MSVEQKNLRSKEKPFNDECGVVGIYTKSKASSYIRTALSALQHRGQESAGMAVFNSNGAIKTYTGMGLVSNVLTQEVVLSLGKYSMAIGHNRYSTSQGSEPRNAQPITLESGSYRLGLAQNGNLYDLNFSADLSQSEASDGVRLTTFLLQERTCYSSWLETLQKTLPQIGNAGAFSLVLLTDEGCLYGIKDPYAIRPLCLGILSDGFVLASETVALDMLEASFSRELKGGEILRIDPLGEIHSSFYGLPQKASPCVFEGIYFSRPDSLQNNHRVGLSRENCGEALAERLKNKGINPDVVVPIMDSGLSAALGVNRELNRPLIPAVTTSHYTGRTFIQPGKENRASSVNGKHNFSPEGIQDKVVVFVDDSGVRFTTSPHIVEGLRKMGAKEIHAAFASPPVVNPCDLGIDTPTRKELPASQWHGQSLEEIELEIAELIGADSVTFLPINETTQAMGGNPKDFCHHCFGGLHPVKEPQVNLRQAEKLTAGKPKILVFISGSGTNFQEIINGVEEGNINASIVGVLSNNSDAYGLIRAENHDISAKTLPSQGKLKNPNLRQTYEQELITYVKEVHPNLIVLAGWMIVLGDDFLQQMQELEITVINLHPALLPEKNKSTINTSKGKIPVLRGTHVIQKAHEANIPVSGVTIHQLLPGNPFDTGPVVIKAEVPIKPDETLDQWEQRIHQAEYYVLPTAINRVLQVLRQGIDPSKGDFPW